MDDPPRQRSETVTSLRDAIRKARLEDAERGTAIADLRAGELVRLEILRDALAPIFAELPDEGELFDHGLVPGEHPRLFVDILAFVEMGRDKRQYRFVQNSRWGQRILFESDDIQAVIRAVTDYVALRLVERRKALAADGFTLRGPAAAPKAPAQGPVESPLGTLTGAAAQPRPPTAPVLPMPPPSSVVQAIASRRPSAASPVLVFVLGVVAGILVTLFLGLMRARGLLAF